mgnify:CR=1 FL=1
MNMGLKMKATDMTSKDMKMDMDLTMGIAGQDMVIKAYYTDGYYYMNYSGQKQKQKMDFKPCRNRWRILPDSLICLLIITKI